MEEEGWTYRRQYVRCGKPACRCAGGEGHGPYWYGFRRQGGMVESKYFGKRRPRAPRSRARPMTYGVPPEVEADVLAVTRRWPAKDKRRVALLVGRVSSNGVLTVWRRRGVPTTARERGAWAADQEARGVPRPRRRTDVECPACHRRFVAEGWPPFSCPRCGVGGIGREAEERWLD